jgi:hypothetical protein
MANAVDLSLPALSIRQPFAFAIMTARKTIENRTWRTRHRGRLLIHAARLAAPGDWLTLAQLDLLPDLPEQLTYGALLGTVELIDVLPLGAVCGDVWAAGPWCWCLRDPQSFAEPIPCAGMCGLFHPRV